MDWLVDPDPGSDLHYPPNIDSVSCGTIGGGGVSDTTAPVISDVQTRSLRGNKFEIKWTTDEPATSNVEFDCCGMFPDSTLTTNHRRVFRPDGEYTFTVQSTDAAGNTQSDGPNLHQ